MQIDGTMKGAEAAVIKVDQLHELKEVLGELSELLVRVVEEGASVGFLAPLDLQEALKYWEGVPSPEVRLFIIRVGERLAGTVQLQLCPKANGQHRAEVAKLMIHPDFRKQGLGRRLMETVETSARAEGRSLLVLDTREGDVSNRLYQSLGYKEAGRIPRFALSSNGELDGTVIYYKEL